jgi:hypothetical protein
MKVVFGKLKDRGYPQDITEAEADMKFQRLLVQGIGNWKDGRMSSKSVPVVARILSPTDAIIKVFDLTGCIRYVHWRHGYFESLRGLKSTAWQPLSPPTADTKQLISDFDSGVRKKGFAGDVIGVPFDFRAA